MADIPPTFRLSVPDDFGVDVVVDGGDVVVTVRGELDVLTAPFLWERMEPVLAGVATPDGTVLSVPPDLVEAVRAAGDDLGTVARALPGLVGRPDARFGRGVFRWSHSLVDVGDPEAVWLPPDDERVPPWLAVFN